MNIPADLKYSNDHEWICIQDNVVTIGITDFAQGELGDIVYVEIDSLDDEIEEGEVMGSIEAVKTVSDIFIPVSGRVIAINEKLENEPELVNSDPYGEGWIAKIEIPADAKMSHLLDADGYQTLIGV